MSNWSPLPTVRTRNTAYESADTPSPVHGTTTEPKLVASTHNVLRPPSPVSRLDHLSVASFVMDFGVE